MQLNIKTGSAVTVCYHKQIIWNNKTMQTIITVSKTAILIEVIDKNNLYVERHKWVKREIKK